MITGVKTATPHAHEWECERITKTPILLSFHFDIRYIVLNKFFIYLVNHCVGCFDSEDVNLFKIYCIGLAHEMVISPMVSSEISVKGI